jgi:hypothetical protein
VEGERGKRGSGVENCTASCQQLDTTTEEAELVTNREELTSPPRLSSGH